MRALTAVALFLSCSSAFADIVIVSDPFTDGARTNGADPLDIAWLEQNSTATTTVNAQAESAITGNGMFVDSGANFRPMVGQFAPITLGVGERLELRFDFRIFSAGTTATSTTPTAQGVDVDFRMGLFSSNGTSPTTDNATASGNDFGYRSTVLVGPGAAAQPSLLQEFGTAPDILGGADSTTIVASSGTSGRINDILAHSGLLTVTRTATGVDLSFSAFDGIGQTGTLLMSSTGTDTGAVNNSNSSAGVYTVFDIVAFSSGGTDFNYRLDNISVTYVPEPSFGLGFLVALGGIAALRLRARRITATKSQSDNQNC